MGCVNSEGQFSHWFGNIHLSGPCNRACYFCIGQHMQSLERLNNLGKWPLDGIDEFIAKCKAKNISEINLTGTNTDPLLFQNILPLRKYLEAKIPNLKLGLRTNGALAHVRTMEMAAFDKISLSIHSFDTFRYRKLMGSGYPPNIVNLIQEFPKADFKINIVIGPENIADRDIIESLNRIAETRIKKVNLREPYGQPHLGDPMKKWGCQPSGDIFGMPVYSYRGLQVCYWDVHFVEVESVNLYANGVVSETYPVTKGYDSAEGRVVPQPLWVKSGRQFQQWQ